MKKVLYTTTALAAAGMLAFGASDAMAQAKAEPLSVSISGSFKSIVGWASEDDSFNGEGLPVATNTATVHRDSFNVWNDSELQWRGKTVLENGLGAQVIIQLETDQATAGSGGNAVIDESYLTLFGGFGEARIGTTKSAGFVLRSATPWTGAIPFDNPDLGNHLRAPAGHGVGHVATHIGGADNMKIVYISPQFSGFRIGATYEPTNANSNLPGAIGGNAGTDTTTWDAVLQYQDKLGNANFVADVAYWEQTGTAANSTQNVRIGAKIGFGDISIGGSYRDQGNKDSGKNNSTTSDELEAYDVGVTWSPKGFTVGATYVHGDAPLSSATTGSDTTDKFFLGANVAMGPGVNLLGSLAYAKYEDEGTAVAANNDGWAVIGAVQVRF